MRAQKWFFLPCLVLLTVWTIISIWAMDKVGVLEIVQREYAAFSARKTIEHYLASTGVRKLQIGAGPNNLSGWLNTDIEPREGQAFLDAMKPFPIPDNSLNYIYAEQVIEHLPFEGGMVMLRESHRVLAPGGKLRVATPDLRQLVALFDRDNTEAEQRFMTAQLKMVGLRVKEPERPLFIMNMYFMRGAIDFSAIGKRFNRPWSLWDFETFASCVTAKATTRNCVMWSAIFTRLGVISTSM